MEDFIQDLLILLMCGLLMHMHKLNDVRFVDVWVIDEYEYLWLYFFVRGANPSFLFSLGLNKQVHKCWEILKSFEATWNMYFVLWKTIWKHSDLFATSKIYVFLGMDGGASDCSCFCPAWKHL